VGAVVDVGHDEVAHVQGAEGGAAGAVQHQEAALAVQGVDELRVGGEEAVGVAVVGHDAAAGGQLPDRFAGGAVEAGHALPLGDDEDLAGQGDGGAGDGGAGGVTPGLPPGGEVHGVDVAVGRADIGRVLVDGGRRQQPPLGAPAE